MVWLVLFISTALASPFPWSHGFNCDLVVNGQYYDTFQLDQIDWQWVTTPALLADNHFLFGPSIEVTSWGYKCNGHLEGFPNQLNGTQLYEFMVELNGELFLQIENATLFEQSTEMAQNYTASFSMSPNTSYPFYLEYNSSGGGCLLLYWKGLDSNFRIVDSTHFVDPPPFIGLYTTLQTSPPVYAAYIITNQSRIDFGGGRIPKLDSVFFGEYWYTITQFAIFKPPHSQGWKLYQFKYYFDDNGDVIINGNKHSGWFNDQYAYFFQYLEGGKPIQLFLGVMERRGKGSTSIQLFWRTEETDFVPVSSKDLLYADLNVGACKCESFVSCESPTFDETYELHTDNFTYVFEHNTFNFLMNFNLNGSILLNSTSIVIRENMTIDSHSTIEVNNIQSIPITVRNTAYLNGKLVLHYVPTLTEYNVLSGTSISGQFETVELTAAPSCLKASANYTQTSVVCHIIDECGAGTPSWIYAAITTPILFTIILIAAIFYLLQHKKFKNHFDKLAVNP